jgi:hypothetical protein
MSCRVFTAFTGDDDAASLSDGSDVAEPSFPSRPPPKLQPHPPPPLPTMAAKAADKTVATLGVPSALGPGAGNTWVEAVEADALQVLTRSFSLLC